MNILATMDTITRKKVDLRKFLRPKLPSPVDLSISLESLKKVEIPFVAGSRRRLE
jgi:hypothetical protein